MFPSYGIIRNQSITIKGTERRQPIEIPALAPSTNIRIGRVGLKPNNNLTNEPLNILKSEKSKNLPKSSANPLVESQKKKNRRDTIASAVKRANKGIEKYAKEIVPNKTTKIQKNPRKRIIIEDESGSSVTLHRVESSLLKIKKFPNHPIFTEDGEQEECDQRLVAMNEVTMGEDNQSNSSPDIETMHEDIEMKDPTSYTAITVGGMDFDE